MTEWRVVHYQDDGFFTVIQVHAHTGKGEDLTASGAIQYTFDTIPQHGEPRPSFAFPIYWH